MEQVFIEQGDKYIPLQRFDLDPAMASTAFGQDGAEEKKSFEVRRHPIVQSIKTVTIESDKNAPDTSAGQTDETATDNPAAKKAISIKPGGRRPKPNGIGQQTEGSTEPSTEFTIVGSHLPHLYQQGLLKKLKENCPIIDDESSLTIDSVLTVKDGDKRVFPDIVLAPYQGVLFYYETKVNTEGKDDGYLGRITLSYQLTRSKNSKYSTLPVEVENAVLNLKTTKGEVKIFGKVDQSAKKITFEPTGEAVKIAFFNLVSPLEPNQCDIDIFYQFKGVHLELRRNKITWKPVKPDHFITLDPTIGKPLRPGFEKPIKPGFDIPIKPGFDKPIKTGIDKPIKTGIDKPSIKSVKRTLEPQLLMRSTPMPQASGGSGKGVIDITSKFEYVESTYVVKMNKRLSYPFDTNRSLYRSINGVVDGNPFRLNDDFAEFKQVFCNDINRDVVSVYKSLFSRNTFLVFPKQYYIARNENQPCIYSTTFLNEEGVTEKERQEISKINFSFTIASTLSEYVLAKIKLALYNNGLLDPRASSEDIKKYLFDPNEVLLMFPNDVGAFSYPDGDEFLATSSITQDGHYFNLICETEDLGKASLFITAINSAQERYFNIVSDHKEIHHSAVVELNMNKTIGEFLHWEIKNNSIEISNESYSPCRIYSMMLVNSNGEALINGDYFNNKADLNSDSKMTVKIKDLTSRPDFQHPVKVYLEYESIEDITTEFQQETDQLSAYYRNVVLDFSNIKNPNVNIMIVNVTALSTGCVFTFKKNIQDFDRPILMTIVTKNVLEPNTKLEITRKYYDQRNKQIKSDTMIWDYTMGANIDLSLPKQE